MKLNQERSNMTNKRLSLMMLLIFTLIGCRKYYININTVSANGVVSFQFYSHELEELNVDYIEVTNEDREPVWRIVNDEPKKITELTYGNIPEGFREIIKAKKLLKGKEYCILVVGSNFAGNASFVL